MKEIKIESKSDFYDELANLLFLADMNIDVDDLLEHAFKEAEDAGVAPYDNAEIDRAIQDFETEHDANK